MPQREYFQGVLRILNLGTSAHCKDVYPKYEETDPLHCGGHHSPRWEGVTTGHVYSKEEFVKMAMQGLIGVLFRGWVTIETTVNRQTKQVTVSGFVAETNEEHRAA